MTQRLRHGVLTAVSERWGDAERWVAEARVAEAAHARSRRHWLRRQLDAEATLRGVLLDLAERSDLVAVTSATGSEHAGRLTTVGADYVAVETPTATVLVPLASLTSVRAGPGGPAGAGHPAAGARTAGLVDALSDLAAAATPVRVGAAGAVWVSGSLVALGQDVLTLAVPGPPPATVYVSLESLAEVSVGVTGSG